MLTATTTVGAVLLKKLNTPHPIREFTCTVAKKPPKSKHFWLGHIQTSLFVTDMYQVSRSPPSSVLIPQTPSHPRTAFLPC